MSAHTPGLERVRLCCPVCARQCAGAPLYRYATTVVNRRCRKCGMAWVVVLAPFARTAKFVAHRVEWTPSARAALAKAGEQ